MSPTSGKPAPPTLSVSDGSLLVLAPDGSTTMLPVPPGAAVVNPELTPLTHGYLVTWVTAFSHTLQANYAVLNRAGHLVTDAAVGDGYTTALDAVALPGGGFLLADAQSNLFGQHATLIAETFNARGQLTSGPLTVADQTRPAGGLYIMGLEGHEARGRVVLTWEDRGQSASAVVWPHGHSGDAHDGPAPMDGPTLPGFSHDAWFV